MRAMHLTTADARVSAPAAAEYVRPPASTGRRIAAEAIARSGIDAAMLSVVVPAHNEAGNLPALVAEALAALRGVCDFEIVCVDDASTDGTLEALRPLRAQAPELRILHHAARCGQSTAISTGVRAARGAWIATLDGDGQNDPADIPRLLHARDASAAEIKLFVGWRVQRRDSGGKRRASRWANAIRARLLRDDTPDTGCGTKLFDRAAFLELPYFDHMHRYLPALMQRAGWRTLSVPVNHRPRASGASKYDNLGRALAGVVDLAGVLWLMRRARRTGIEEV